MNAAAIPKSLPIADWLRPLIEEVTDLRRQVLGRSDHEQTIRMALHAGLLSDRDTLRMILESTATERAA